MTPREVVGNLHFVLRQRRVDAGEMLALTALGSRGDPKAVKEELGRLTSVADI